MTTLLKSIFLRLRHVALYGFLLAVLVFVLKWLQWKYLVVDISIELYIGLIAVFFTILGVWVAIQLVKPKVHKEIVEKEVYVTPPGMGTIDKNNLKKLKLSGREYEVLQLLARGHSNAAIAEKLFLSISTVKTHVSNLYIKMDVKSRTQAIEKAGRLNIIE